MSNNENGMKANDVICQILSDKAASEKDLLVLTSDSRGSAGLTPFIEANPDKSVEMGIAEQNAVTVAAGLAHAGKKPFVFSPAAFLSARAIEQVKVDAAYSQTNVKLIGISGGNSYSDLGMSHHSLQDIAITTALPNLEVYTPADQFETRALFKYLLESDKAAFVRIGKQKLPDVYHSDWKSFTPGKANVLREGNDVCLISSGETLIETVKAAEKLALEGVNAMVVDLVSLKPLDEEFLHHLSEKFNYIFTIEEHSIINGLGARVATIAAQHAHAKLKILGFPDEPAISGTQAEVFEYYGLSAQGIAKTVTDTLETR